MRTAIYLFRRLVAMCNITLLCYYSLAHLIPTTLVINLFQIFNIVYQPIPISQCKLDATLLEQLPHRHLRPLGTVMFAWNELAETRDSETIDSGWIWQTDRQTNKIAVARGVARGGHGCMSPRRRWFVFLSTCLRLTQTPAGALPLDPAGGLQSPSLSLIHIWRCRRIERCRSRWSPYH